MMLSYFYTAKNAKTRDVGEERHNYELEQSILVRFAFPGWKD